MNAFLQKALTRQRECNSIIAPAEIWEIKDQQSTFLFWAGHEAALHPNATHRTRPCLDSNFYPHSGGGPYQLNSLHSWDCRLDKSQNCRLHRVKSEWSVASSVSQKELRKSLYCPTWDRSRNKPSNVASTARFIGQGTLGKHHAILHTNDSRNRSTFPSTGSLAATAT